MGFRLDRDTIERLRGQSPSEVVREMREAVYRAGGSGSEDFLDVYEQLVAEDVLTWGQIEELDR